MNDDDALIKSSNKKLARRKIKSLSEQLSPIIGESPKRIEREMLFYYSLDGQFTTMEELDCEIEKTKEAMIYPYDDSNNDDK